MPATVMRNDSISVLREKQHLAVPRIRAQRPSVGERDHWARAPFLVIDCCAVTSRDCRHWYPPSLSRCRLLNNTNYLSCVLPALRRRLWEQAGKTLPESLHWHEHRSALVLDQEHEEFCWFGAAGVPTNDMDIVGAFIKGLPGCQRDFFSALQLHHDGAFQHVHKRVGIVSMDRV